MSYITEYKNSYKNSLKKARELVVVETIDMESEIRGVIKQRWLRGLRPNGDIIGVYRDDMYQVMKSNMNPSAGGKVDLILSGDLVNRIHLVLSGMNSIQVISSDEKYDEISKRYGSDNFNLSEEEQDEIFREVAAKVIINIYKDVVF